MQWSKYNMMFESKNNGWLLYNTGSNTFVQMDDETAAFVKEVKEYPNRDFADYPDIMLKLRLGGFLVEDGKDEELYNILKMEYLNIHFASHHMVLTIAPTRKCNFDCPYCYERNRKASCINDVVEDKIVSFINKHKMISKIFVSWYGGEPLMEIERIKSFTKKIKALGKKFSAALTTNGYLLTSEVIDTLDELEIVEIEITIDGIKETHDRRRYLVGGEPTYEIIMCNIDGLLLSGWKGRLEIRVNIDVSNKDDFVEVYRLFEYKYPSIFGKQVVVLPAFVYDRRSQDNNGYFNSREKGEFLANLASMHSINALPIFPRTRKTVRGCCINSKNAYLIGPNGELYKCWDDLGEESEIIGYVDNLTNWNASLIAQGAVEASYMENEICKNCFCFPICDGGCPKSRIFNKRDGANRDYCSYFKSHAKEFLEIHFEQKKKAVMT